MDSKNCITCKCLFKRIKKHAESRWINRKFCSKKCYSISKIKGNLYEFNNEIAYIIIGQKKAIIDSNDYIKAKEHTWRIDGGYVKTTNRETKDTLFLHHLIIGKHTHINLVIDHINRIKLDNRKSNLRIVSQTENIRNKADTNKYGKSGVNKNGNGYIARISVNNTKINLGTYKKLEDAIKARIIAEETYWY